MVERANRSGHPPDVTALMVTKETDATTALRGSREMAARNAYKATMEIIVVMISVNY